MEKNYNILNLGCAHCGGRIEEAIKKIDGIEDAVLNFPMRKIKIKGDITEELLNEINSIAGKIEAGVEIIPDSHGHNNTKDEDNHEHHCECCHDHEHHHHSHDGKSNEKKTVNIDILLFVVGIHLFVAAIAIQHLTSFSMTLLIYII